MQNALKTTILLAALTGLFLVVGQILGGTSGMFIAFIFALVMNFGAYWFSGSIALKMAGAHEVTAAQAPELYQLVEELATYARLPMPKVAVIDSPSPNAFATGRDSKHAVIAVTTGIMGVLSRDELAGVLAHELGHVKNKDILVSSVAATIAGAISMLASMAQWALIFGGFGRSDDDGEGVNPFAALVMMIIAPIAATIIHLAISRSREFGADATGAAIHGNPESLARALEKLDTATSMRPLPVNPSLAHLFIVNPLKGQSLAGLFSTHPPLEERIKRLRSMQLRSIY